MTDATRRGAGDRPRITIERVYFVSARCASGCRCSPRRSARSNRVLMAWLCWVPNVLIAGRYLRWPRAKDPLGFLAMRNA